MELFTPIEYLKIDIASNFGLDKETWAERLNWVDTRESFLETLVEEAENPALFYAGLKAYRDAQAGKDIRYIINLDATASGAQILAALINCPKSASMCNLVDTGRREDLYTNVFQHMLLRSDIDQNFERESVKQAVMTALYGSTAEPKKAFGEGETLLAFYDVMETEATGIWSLNHAMLNFWNPNKLSHDWIMPDGFEVKIKVMVEDFYSPTFIDEPQIIVKEVNATAEYKPELGAHITHSIDGMVVRELVARCHYSPAHIRKVKSLVHSLLQGHSVALYSPDTEERRKATLKSVERVRKFQERYEQTKFVSSRMVASLNEYSLMELTEETLWAVWEYLESLPKKPFKVLSVHDCFRVHPNYGNDLRRQYNEILATIADSTILDDLASQLMNDSVTVTKQGALKSDIQNANYALS